MSAAASRSMRKIRPLARASMRTLFATCAATKSADKLNWSCTRSMLKIGNDGSAEAFSKPLEAT